MSPIWFTLALFAASLVLGELLRPKPDLKNAKPAGLGDFQFPTAAEDRRVPLLWGTVLVKGPNVVWADDLRIDPITERVRTGLFSSETFVKGYRYHIGMQLVFCEGPIDGLRRMWIKDALVVDGTSALVEHGDTFTIDDPELFGGEDLGNGGFEGTFEFFAGTSDQMPSDYLTPFIEHNGQAPAYRHYCYIAPFADPPYVGNSTTIDAPRFELRRIATAEANGLGLADPTVNGHDANPMNVLYEVLTNLDWGKKIDPAEIDEASFVDAAVTLKAEGNGFSFLLDREEQIGDLVRQIEQQIDGTIYKHPGTGLWTAKLARDDYDVEDIPLFTDGSDGEEANVVEVETFTRGTWEATANVVSIEFANREGEYTTTYATAQNDANIALQGGNRVPAGDRYGGVKDPTLADSIAWRDLRTLSSPLAQARVVTDRTTYEVQPYDVVRLTFTGREFAVRDLPMRVKWVDRGSLLDGRIVYELVEDVFRAGAGSYGPPPASGWDPPEIGLEPFDAAEQVAFEAPRALTVRDPDSPLPYLAKVYAAARQPGSATAFDIRARHSASSPSGDFDRIGTVYRFVKIGELAADLPVGSAVPHAVLAIESTPDSDADILAELPGSLADAPTTEMMGTELLGLAYCTGEFWLIQYAQDGTGTQVNLRNVYRGALDSVQKEHSAGEAVFLLFVGGGMSTDTVPAAHNVDVKLIPRSYQGAVDEGDATTISFSMEDRTRRPYAPSELSLNGQRFDDTVDLEGGGPGHLDGIIVALLRRDFTTTNEVASLEADAEAIDTTPPNKHEIVITLDPDDTAEELFTYEIEDAASAEIPRSLILWWTDGVLPERLRFSIKALHDFEGSSRDSLYSLVWDFDITTELTGFANLGVRTPGQVASYVSTFTGSLSYSLAVAISSDVEWFNPGPMSWETLIPAGNTGGAIAVVPGFNAQVRHNGVGHEIPVLVTVDAVGGTPHAYAVFADSEHP